MDDFLIITLKPALERERSDYGRNDLRVNIESLVFFLQDNNLTARELLTAKGTIEDDFKLMRSDITEVGFKVLQKTMTKWLDKVSAGKCEPDDVSMLERKLKKVLDQNVSTALS